jgi:TonB-dependent starch-binding outer membrane protein SusC
MKIYLPDLSHIKFFRIFTLSLFLLVGQSHANAQDSESRSINGRITSAVTSEAIPGVSVYEKGTTNGSVSDVDGNYLISVKPGATLVVSSVGYQSEEVVVGSNSTINVILTEDIRSLDEIVVVGYGEQKRSNVTGAVSSVAVENLSNKTQLRLDQALQGMAAGVTVTRNGGAPGSAPTIHIRGVGSIGNTEPLWIIDGIRMEPGNHFDVDDVESMEILKDAAASAIYGARAAHGVILVTTKRGKNKDLLVNYKTSIGQRSPIRLPEMLGAEDFIKYKNQARVNAGLGAIPWGTFEANTDWVNEYYRGDGVLQSHDVSISKGDEKLNYYLSFGYDRENGILIDNNYKRYSVRLNSDAKLRPWIKIGESLLLSRVNENPISNFNENYSGGIPYRSIPIMPVYDPNNEFGGWGKTPAGFEGFFQGPNPVASQYQQHELRTSNRIDGNVYAEIQPLKGLTLRATGGYNYLGYMGEKFDEAFNYGSFSNPLAALTYSAASDNTLTGNLVATYSKIIGKHAISIMGGYEAIQFQTRHFNLIGNNFPIDVARSMNLATGSFNTTDRQNVYESRLLSQFGRLSYNYDERYLIEANLRRDASAPKFGPSNIWGVFPSVSLGWRISEEAFFDNVPYVTNLKLRASTGKLGSDNIGSFIYLKTYTSQFSTYAFDVAGTNKVSGFFISRFPNAEVKWEEVNMKNVAVDLKAFDNKLSLSVDYYVKNTKDLLYAIPIPSSVGIAVHNFNPVNPEVNIGTMRNRGIDIDFGYTTSIDKLSINIGGNTSFLKNEMKSLNGDQAITGGSGGELQGGMTRTQPGMPVSSFYGYVVQQMLNTAGDVYAINTYAGDGTYQEAGTAPGDFMYVDISGPDGVPDGEVTAQYDRTFIGNPWPKMTYALNLGATYNNMFDISIQFQGVQGVDVYNANKAYTRNLFGDNNTSTDIYEAWTPENKTNHPRNVLNDPNGNFSRPSSYFIENGSYLKLRNIQVGFTMPKRVLDKVNVNKFRIYVNANNLLTLTKYTGFDPEIAGSNIGRGVDYGLYPQVRTVSGGLEIQF